MMRRATSSLARYSPRVALWLALSASACSVDRLLEVDTPDQVTTSNTASASGAQAQRVAGIGLFSRFFAASDGSTGIGLNVTTAILSDEAFTARGGSEHLDIRAQDPALFPANASWAPFGDAYNGLTRGIRALNKFPPAAPSAAVSQTGQLYMLSGFVFTLMAETHCNGIPVSNVTDDAPSTTTFTTPELYAKALVLYDSALATLSTSPSDQTFRHAARIGKARTFVNLDQYDKAAQVVGAGGDGAGSQAVPSSYVYNVEMSNATTLTINSAFNWFTSTKNFGAADKEGINGLDFVSARDPRIAVDGTRLGAGQDGTLTPLFNQFPAINTPVMLASGIEARLIEAEYALKRGDAGGALALLNAVRTTKAGLAPLADPGSPSALVDLLFRERALWMYFTAHRLGDLRRLVRQYRRPPETVFPTGAYAKGGRYGTELVLVPAQTELNNPAWGGPGSTDPKKVCRDMQA
ncbi:MAG: hypothetical protein H7066_10325 [Cytophagaceae bacterium]|nr:hypothetical protein [Gemmatimonadaceae bacterium]